MTRPAHRPVLESVGVRLRELRHARGWTLVDAAAEARVSRESLRSWERGRRDPGLDAVARLADVYEVQAGDLFPGSGAGDTYRAAAVRYRETLDALGPYRGPCGLCGHPDARHRQADAITGGLLAGDDVATATAEYLPADLAGLVFAGELALKVAFATLATDPRLHDVSRDRACWLDREVWAATVRDWETARAAGAGR